MSDAASGIARLWRSRRRPPGLWRRLSASQLLVSSFVCLVLGGTIGFKVLPGLYTGEPLSWLDALFTATSAVCVTGLIVVDTATYFTSWGQAYVLLLIQLGGLGIITFSTILLSALGRRLSLRHEDLARSAAGPSTEVDHRRLARHVVGFTFAVEAVGAVLLWLLWVDDFGIVGAMWPAVFHSISAFCNAGFSTFSDSLMGFAESPGLLGVVMTLIVVGGIGFLVLEELYRLSRRPTEGRRRRLSVHSRLVLFTTALLIGGGWVLFGVFEWDVTLAQMSNLDRLANSLFLSVTARTAGFNTVDYGAVATDTNFLTILLMTIGGSPGSTAGGMKTTTFALVGLVAWARLRGRDRVTLWDRSIPEETLQRAVGLVVVAFGMVTAAIFVLSWTELSAGQRTGEFAEASFLSFMFEAASAFNTVGLSMGATGALSTAGRWAVIVLMFIGRVGPLTFAAALSRRQQPEPYHFAQEDVGIG